MGATMPGQTALRLDGVTKYYGKLTAVDHINLEIAPGQVFGILGPNGAGKSTLIRMIAGLLPPDDGTVRLPDGGLRQGSGHVGLCPQELVIWEELTIMEQLIFMAQMHDVPRQTARARAEHLLAGLGLEEKRNTRASRLSGGMKRRLNMMLALMHEPQLIIFDEPHAGLDPQSRILVRNFIKELAHSKTVILTTHDMDEVVKTAHRVAVVDRGKLLAEDSPERLIRSKFPLDFVECLLDVPEQWSMEVEQLFKRDFPGLTQQAGTVRVESANPYEHADFLQSKLHSTGIAVTGVRIRKPSLEDVFIAMTGRGLRE